MNRDEYLAKCNPNDSVTFIIAKSVKDEGIPSYYYYTYVSTPIRAAWEWAQSEKDYLVINADHPPIDVTGHWVRSYKQGHLKCAMLTTEDDLLLHYGEKQGRDMIEFYKKKVK